jgi:hypothetical protein
MITLPLRKTGAGAPEETPVVGVPVVGFVVAVPGRVVVDPVVVPVVVPVPVEPVPEPAF